MAEKSRLNRRTLLVSGVAATATVAGVRIAQAAFDGLSSAATVSKPAVRLRQFQLVEPPSGTPPPRRWSDPATWHGLVPASNSSVAIHQPILLDVNATVAGLTIHPTGRLIFEPGASRTLISTRNVVVLGQLKMTPDSPGSEHTLRFVNVDEARFKGGGSDVADDDVGLWCVGNGTLDVAGSPKMAWARSRRDIPVGSTSVELEADPNGWQVGDEIAIAPSTSPTTTDHFAAYDYARVRSVSGRLVRLTEPTRHNHPRVDVGHGFILGPEILNLTRNVRLEGTKSGRAHIFIKSGRVQRIAHATIRYMGPRKPTSDGTSTASIDGRYALHFHHAHDGTRGSRVFGTVVRDCGSHAFVAHESHGITYDSCISHDTFDDAYWWDPRPAQRQPSPMSHDIVYRACVASLVKTDPKSRGFRLCGFNLRAGDDCRAEDCVAVGVQGNNSASGFQWPEGSDSVWKFDRCVSHNNRVHGIFTWQNSKKIHSVENFVCYHNGGAGVSHGAYLTSYIYRNAFLCGNRAAGIQLHAHSYQSWPQRFERIFIDCKDLSDHSVETLKHQLDAGRSTEFIDSEFVNSRGAAVGLYAGTASTTPEVIDIIECSSGAKPMLRFSENTRSGSVLRVQTGTSAVQATVVGTPGSLRPDWNAVVNPIPRFSTAAVGRSAQPFKLLAGAVAPSS
jgi:hypothetical protein